MAVKYVTHGPDYYAQRMRLRPAGKFWYGTVMIRLIVLLGIIATLAYIPLYTLDKAVMPELFSLERLYSGAEATADGLLQN